MRKSFLNLGFLVLILACVHTSSATSNIVTLDDLAKKKMNSSLPSIPEGTVSDPMTITGLKAIDYSYRDELASTRAQLENLINIGIKHYTSRYHDVFEAIDKGIVQAEKHSNDLLGSMLQDVKTGINDIIYNQAAYKSIRHFINLFQGPIPPSRKRACSRFMRLVVNAYVRKEHKEYITKKLLEDSCYRKCVIDITLEKDKLKKITTPMLQQRMKGTLTNAHQQLYRQVIDQKRAEVRQLQQKKDGLYQAVDKKIPKILNSNNLTINPRLEQHPGRSLSFLEPIDDLIPAASTIKELTEWTPSMRSGQRYGAMLISKDFFSPKTKALFEWHYETLYWRKKLGIFRQIKSGCKKLKKPKQQEQSVHVMSPFNTYISFTYDSAQASNNLISSSAPSSMPALTASKKENKQVVYPYLAPKTAINNSNRATYLRYLYIKKKFIAQKSKAIQIGIIHTIRLLYTKFKKCMRKLMLKHAVSVDTETIQPARITS